VIDVLPITIHRAAMTIARGPDRRSSMRPFANDRGCRCRAREASSVGPRGFWTAAVRASVLMPEVRGAPANDVALAESPGQRAGGPARRGTVRRAEPSTSQRASHLHTRPEDRL
jgi:hypothetical protein